MTLEQQKQRLLEIARQYAEQGPGFAQQAPVLRKARQEFGVTTLADQQTILECWQSLFREGRLSWGYNLDNPDAPFFHIPVGDVVSAGS